MEVNVNGYIVLASAVISILAFYIPGFSDWYEKELPPKKKQLIMVAALFVVIAFTYGLGCMGKATAFACTGDGAFDAVTQFAIALAVNAGIYKSTKYVLQRGSGAGPASG